MKNNILKPLAIATLMAGGLFSCAGSGEVADNTGMEPTEVVVTETEVATATTPDGTTIVVADTDVVADTTMMTETQRLANTELDYGDMFDDIEDTEQYDVLALARTNPNLSTFVGLIELSGLAPSLATAGPVTIFAPTNDAFNQMPKERLAELIDENNRTQLVEFIQLHILPSAEVSSLQLTENSFIDRGEQEDIPVSTTADGTVIFVGGAQIVKPNVEASNGVLHVVNDIIETTDEAGADID